MADNPKSLASLAGRYRKKPVVIEAMQLTSNDALAAAITWCGGRPWMVGMEPGVQIKTLEGIMYASPGDWIIRGIAGEFYPCKPDIFAATYEPAAAALRAPTIAADDAECGWCALEECKECPLRRKDHAGVTTHDYEPAHDYVCAGCSGDVLWNSDNYTEHPGHDHDFDPIPFATPSPTIAAQHVVCKCENCKRRWGY